MWGRWCGQRTLADYNAAAGLDDRDLIDSAAPVLEQAQNARRRGGSCDPGAVGPTLVHANQFGPTTAERQNSLWWADYSSVFPERVVRSKRLNCNVRTPSGRPLKGLCFIIYPKSGKIHLDLKLFTVKVQIRVLK